MVEEIQHGSMYVYNMTGNEVQIIFKKKKLFKNSSIRYVFRFLCFSDFIEFYIMYVIVV